MGTVWFSLPHSHQAIFILFPISKYESIRFPWDSWKFPIRTHLTGRGFDVHSIHFEQVVMYCVLRPTQPPTLGGTGTE